MKLITKRVIYSLLLAFIISFAFFFCEPFSLYANNTNDLWFDIYIMFPSILILFSISFAIISAILLITLFITHKTNHPIIFERLYIIITGIFVCLYIHSNFLSSLLPPLNGDAINWNELLPNVVSIVVCLATIVGIIICCRKKFASNFVKYCALISSAIFIMLSVSVITTISTTDVLKRKDTIFAVTDNNINSISTNKNFLILLVDAVDSVPFNEIIKSNDEYSEIFKDFTYYPDTLSGYAFTRDSIPFILTNKWNKNETNFTEYSTNAYKNSPLLHELSSLDYQKNLYEYELIWNDPSALELDNAISEIAGVNEKIFIKQELKYIIFKSFPHPLKKFSKISSMNFGNAREVNSTKLFQWDNPNFYFNTLKQPLQKINQNYFQFIHIEGAHTPFTVDENLNPIPNGTYEQKLEATAKIVLSYINRLKESGVYDNSVIVIMSDHGYTPISDEEMLERHPVLHSQGNHEIRQNPILYIKGFNETQKSMQTSDKQISHEDLSQAFIELLDSKQNHDIFTNIPTSDRTRTIIYNTFNNENHMVEYTQNGKASDRKSATPTGNIFDLLN